MSQGSLDNSLPVVNLIDIYCLPDNRRKFALSNYFAPTNSSKGDK
jgi:hypothetical protein